MRQIIRWPLIIAGILSILLTILDFFDVIRLNWKDETPAPKIKITSSFGSTSKKPLKSYALLFAVDNYQTFPKLNNPIKNARAIADELKNVYDFEVEVVKDPTRSEVRQKLMEWSEDFNNQTKDRNGQLLIFFSGHGEYREQFENGYWVPADGDGQDLTATTLLYNEWRPFINSIACDHILVVIDACFSGTFDPRIALRSDSKFKRPNEPGDADQLLSDHQKRKTRLYLASGGKEKTPDRSEFSKRLLAGLRKGPNMHGILSIDELYVNQVKLARPKPLFGAFGDDEAGSSFLLISKNWQTSYLPEDTEKTTMREADLKDWRAAQREHSLRSYQSYLNNQPKGIFTQQAQDSIFSIGDQNEWEIAAELDTYESYQAYLESFPDGRYTQLAKFRMDQGRGTITDRDGNSYPYKRMKDGKRWMTKNLNLKVAYSSCYDEDPANCRKYGRLYPWGIAEEACAELGQGWRLPTEQDWRELALAYGGLMDSEHGKHVEIGDANLSYRALMEHGDAGFDALLGGKKDGNGRDRRLGEAGLFWTTETMEDGKMGIYFGFDVLDQKLWIFADYAYGSRSVRCLKD